MKDARWRWGSKVAFVALLACAKPETRGHAGATSVVPAEGGEPVEDVALDRAPLDSDGLASEGAAEAGLELVPSMTSVPVWGKSIGHTSVVFKLRLDDGSEAAWKPRSRRGANRYRGEIAAYRLGRKLGLSNVPLAVPRSFPLAQLRAALGDPATGAGKLLADEAVPDARGEVRGALIPWIPDLRFLDLEAEPRRAEWRAWLRSNGSVPPDKTRLALQISTMIVFDYLTANWDRWSGGNIGTDATGQPILFIDNDGAFFDPPPAAALARQRALLADVAHFSRRFIAALHTLEPEVARAAMGEDAPGEPLLAPRVLAGLEERRRTALALVDAAIVRDGQDRVLSFE